MPKWKLTTLGLNSSTTSHIAAVNGRAGRRVLAGIGRQAELAIVGLQPLAPAGFARRVRLWDPGWTKKLTLIGRPVPCFTICSSPRRVSGVSMAAGIEPMPPASEAAIAICGETGPAIGAWMIGCSMPNRSSRRRSCHFMGISFAADEHRRTRIIANSDL